MSSRPDGLKQLRPGAPEAGVLLGDLHPLLQQLGSADGLITLSGAAASLQRPPVDTPEALREFLAAYRTQILLGCELPAICRAYAHASRNETRELIALDQKVGADPRLRDFAAASRRVGRAHLTQLRTLRGERLLRRYLEAVTAGRAQGWHTLVYGLTLVLYSLPVRQGLIHYGRQTLGGFIQAAARPVRLSADQSREMFEQLAKDLPSGVETVLAASGLEHLTA